MNPKPTFKKIEQYITTDGMTFTIKKEAVKHQKGLDAFEAFKTSIHYQKMIFPNWFDAKNDRSFMFTLTKEHLADKNFGKSLHKLTALIETLGIWASDLRPAKYVVIEYCITTPDPYGDGSYSELDGFFGTVSEFYEFTQNRIGEVTEKSAASVSVIDGYIEKINSKS